jgi:hypothetical protein
MTIQSREKSNSAAFVICPQCGRKDDIDRLMGSYLCNRCELVFSRREATMALIIVRLQEEIRNMLAELEKLRTRPRREE